MAAHVIVSAPPNAMSLVFVAANGGDAHMTCASTQLREIKRVTAEASQRRRLKREASELHAQRWALRTDSTKNPG